MQPRHALSTNAHTTQDHSTLHKTPGALRSDLHVLIPASRPDPNLCKAILSGNVLGYPRPTIINWNQTFDDPAFVEGGSHLAKINGTAQYLYSLDVSRDEDLVLMIAPLLQHTISTFPEKSMMGINSLREDADGTT